MNLRYQLPLAGALIVAASFPQVSSGEWTRLIDEELLSHPKNLARHHLGAQLAGQGEAIAIAPSALATDLNLSPDALLIEDPTVGFPIVQGGSEAIVELSEIDILKSMSFTNQGGAGKVIIYTSLTRSAAEDGRWHEAGYAIFDAEKTSVSVQLGGIDAKLVKVVFEVAEPGRVYGFGVFGESRVDEFAMLSLAEVGQAVSGPPQVGASAADNSSLDFNLLAAYSGARIAYVSSGGGNAAAMIDGDSTTSYRFDNSDILPTIIVDLGGASSLSRTAALFDEGTATRISAYALPVLPESEDWVGRTSFDPSQLRDIRPVAVGSDIHGEGRLALDFGSVDSRYVVIQFAPAQEGEEIVVRELAAFSDSVAGSHFVTRSEWLSKSVVAGAKSPKAPLELNPRMVSYTGPLAGYSGASYLRRGSGGLGGNGGSIPGGGGEDVVEEVVNEITDATDDNNPNPVVNVPDPVGPSGGNTPEGGTAFVGSTPPPPPPPPVTTYAPVIQVVSRIAVSATTVPGVGHLYFNAGPNEAPPGYTFVSPSFAGTHPGGTIQAETVAQITVTSTPGGTAPSVITVGTQYFHPGGDTAPPALTLPPVQPQQPLRTGR